MKPAAALRPNQMAAPFFSDAYTRAHVPGTLFDELPALLMEAGLRLAAAGGPAASLPHSPPSAAATSAATGEGVEETQGAEKDAWMSLLLAQLRPSSGDDVVAAAGGAFPG